AVDPFGIGKREFLRQQHEGRQQRVERGDARQRVGGERRGGEQALAQRGAGLRNRELVERFGRRHDQSFRMKGLRLKMLDGSLAAVRGWRISAANRRISSQPAMTPGRRSAGITSPARASSTSNSCSWLLLSCELMGPS